MRLFASCVLAISVLTALVAGSEGSSEAMAPATGPAVLVELFTSQGCSSCPPADELLRELADDETLRGMVVPLSFHVDYWNRLGWKDPFSSGEWSDRQRGYAAENGFRVYTPQMVIDGRADAVGSRPSSVRRALDHALARRPPVEIHLGLTRGADSMDVKATLDWKAKPESESLVLVMAVFETGLVTRVGRGENGGRVLENDFVVRKLQRVGEIVARSGEQRFRTSVRFERGWSRDHVGVALFIQDSKTGFVYGAVAGG